MISASKVMERIITSYTRDGRRTFFDTKSLPWVSVVEAGWKTIRAELDSLLENRGQIPNFQDISEEQKTLTEGGQWKTFFFFGYGHRAEANCAKCPETTRLLGLIPGMKTAMFSILAPGKHIPEHRGPYKGVLRYHLGLIIPKPNSSCRIRVGNEIRSWSEGASVVFDDTHPHEVWNDSDSWRVVLFVDFVRPLPLLLSLLNRLLIWKISTTREVKSAAERVRGPRLIDRTPKGMMTGSGIMTVAELNLLNVDPYFPLVGKTIRPRLQPLGGDTQVVAFGISDEHGPAGIVVADMAAADSAEIVWLYVVQRLRGRGGGTSLLQAVERRALESGKKSAILMYFPDETGGLENFLSARGWTILTGRLTVFCINARIKEAPWFDRWTIPKTFEVFPWVERTDRDRNSLDAMTSKIPEVLRPSRYEYSFDLNTSIGLRRNGQIMGWLLTRQAGPKTIFYNAMFVHEELQGTGLAFAMVADAVRREIEVYGPDSVGVITASQGNPAMMRLINGRLAPYIVWKREAAGAERQLESCGCR